MPHDPVLWKAFQRTDLYDMRKGTGYSAQEMADFAAECMESENSVLLICNTKRQASEVYRCITDAPDLELFHLSTAMCMAHRIHTLQEINRCLEEKRKVVCVSTQLVEAGVDFSFGCVVRVIAGMDNIIQAAGRCNRHGEKGRISPVYIVNIKGENLRMLKEIEDAQNATKNLLEQFIRSPGAYDNDLTSNKAIEKFYEKLYDGMAKNAQDYGIRKYSTTIYNMLSDNSVFKRGKENAFVLNQAAKTAGKEFSVFDENTVDVLVPFKEGAEIIAQMGSERARYDFEYKKELLERAKPYTVSIYEYELKKLVDLGGVNSVMNEAVLVLQPAFYSEQIGFCADGGIHSFLNR